jgi:hypothetical protein
VLQSLFKSDDAAKDHQGLRHNEAAPVFPETDILNGKRDQIAIKWAFVMQKATVARIMAEKCGMEHFHSVDDVCRDSQMSSA